MAKYEVTFQTHINLTVTLDVDADPDDGGEDIAGEQAWKLAEDYLSTVMGDHRQVRAEATLDGIGYDEAQLLTAGTVVPGP